MISLVLSRMFQEVKDEVNVIIRERLSSPFYGSFLVAWLVINWQFLFSALFIDEDKIWKLHHILKIDYLVGQYFPYDTIEHAFSTVARISIIPFLSACFAIFILQRYILIPFYKKNQDHETHKELYKFQKQIEVEKEKLTLSQVEKKSIDIKVESIKKEQEIEQKESSKWASEFELFRSSRYMKDFQKIIDSIYLYRGLIKFNSLNKVNPFQIPPSILAYADSHELIRIFQEDNKIELTEKGRFFVARYQDLVGL